jgi:hypothetical protein
MRATSVLFLASLLLAVSSSSSEAQSAKATPSVGLVYLVNLDAQSVMVSLNGGSALGAPGITAPPELMTMGLGLGKRGDAPAKGVLGVGKNVLTLDYPGRSYLANITIASVYPLSSPLGRAGTCVIIPMILVTPWTAYVTCTLGKASMTFTAPIVPR